jgi:2-oxoglutarate ferredoxin oxidoreductase subunit beta
MSGIGCSSKTRLLHEAVARLQLRARPHAVGDHRRCNAANRTLTYIGISGDGDSLSIGLGQLRTPSAAT